MKKIMVIAFLFSFVFVSALSAESGLICPVSGEKASGKITQEYEGKTYAFCCPKCAKEFKANPGKYASSVAA